jgi:hypothetical protein
VRDRVLYKHDAPPPARNTATPRSSVGDCSRDGEVTIDELVTAVSVALAAASLDVCRAADRGGDGQVTVDEIIEAVNNALSVCEGLPQQPI